MARMTNTSFMTGIKNWVLGKIANITALIPNQASSSNQLADKNFVNSSIATATATFRGTYNVVSDLSLSYNATHAQIEAALAMKMAALSIVADNNDYAFVQIPTSDATPTEIAMIEKYKFNGSVWAFEYVLNNSGFTAVQWAAINSGATLDLIGKLSALPTNTELTALLAAKQDVIQDLATIRSGASSGATAYQKPQGGIPDTDLSSAVQTSLSKADTALQQQDIIGKEDVTTIVAPVNATDATLPITALTCEVGNYYRIDVAVDTLAVTLPAMTDLTTVRTVVIYLTAGTTPAVTISAADSKNVYYQDGFEIEAGSTYEINALFNGAAWIVAAVKINTSNS